MTSDQVKTRLRRQGITPDTALLRDVAVTVLAPSDWSPDKEPAVELALSA